MGDSTRLLGKSWGSISTFYFLRQDNELSIEELRAKYSYGGAPAFVASTATGSTSSSSRSRRRRNRDEPEAKRIKSDDSPAEAAEGTAAAAANKESAEAEPQADADGNITDEILLYAPDSVIDRADDDGEEEDDEEGEDEEEDDEADDDDAEVIHGRSDDPLAYYIAEAEREAIEADEAKTLAKLKEVSREESGYECLKFTLVSP